MNFHYILPHDDVGHFLCPMKRFILSLLLLFTVFCGFAQPRDTTVQATVEFVVNTDRVVDNDLYIIFTREVIPYLCQNKENISFALIEGSASPEGRPENNLKLAQKRADYLKGCLSDIIPEDRIFSKIVTISKSDVSEYPRLRSARISVHLVMPQVDTIYQDNVIERIDTVAAEPTPVPTQDKLAMSIYNSLTGDLLQRPNIGMEFYFKKMSYFIEGSFSYWPLFGYKYNISYWHTGLRKYFDEAYKGAFVEAYGRIGWYDTDFFGGKYGILYGGGLGFGYKFDLGKYWKLYPIIRLGVDCYRFSGLGQGEINISFGKYVDPTETVTETGSQITNSNVFSGYYNLYWFGPTYVGLTIQRNFYYRK